MQNTVVQEIEVLENTLSAKVRELRGPDQEENKEQAYLNKRMELLRDTLHQMVERVMACIQEQVNEILDPLSHLRKKIEGIERKLREKREIWAHKEQIKMADKIQQMMELAAIEEDIAGMEPKEENFENMILFNQDELILRTLECITVKGEVGHEKLKKEISAPQDELTQLEPKIIESNKEEIPKEEESNDLQKQKYLFYINGRFDLSTRKKQTLQYNRKFPQLSARFQINHKYYICGGVHNSYRQKQERSDFFYFNYSGKSTQLQNMQYKRCCMGLAGLAYELICLGGYQNRNLSICEKYIVHLNTWVDLPQLVISRQRPGTILLKSMTAYCFCGSKGFHNNLNSIEKLDMENEGSWRVLPINNEIAQTYHLAAVLFEEKIVVFGGHQNASLNHYIFGLEGSLLQDLSNSKLIPDQMGQEGYVVQDGKIYTAALKVGWFSQNWKLVTFSGKKWSFS